MAAKKRNHMDAIKRNQALHTFMFQTNSTSFMLKDGPSSTKTAKTGCAHSHSKHIWCNICRKAIAYHNMQNAEKHLKTHAALYHQFTSSYNHQFLQSPPVKRVKRSIAQNDEDLVKFGYDENVSPSIEEVRDEHSIEYNFDSEESNGICDSEESNGICDSEGEPNRKLRRSKRLQKNKQIAIQNEVQRESQIKFCIDECIQNEKSEDGDVTWIECEGKDCARKWFHIECLGIAENELSDIKNYFCNDCM
eukprot:390787_1